MVDRALASVLAFLLMHLSTQCTGCNGSTALPVAPIVAHELASGLEEESSEVAGPQALETGVHCERCILGLADSTTSPQAHRSTVLTVLDRMPPLLLLRVSRPQTYQTEMKLNTDQHTARWRTLHCTLH